MRPRRAAVIGARTAREATTAEVRLRSTIRRHSGNGVEARSPPAKPPTALTSTSTR
jgi:hypothetical protein